jgi:cell division transport system permease protein
MSIYLRDGAKPQDVDKLEGLLANVNEVQHVEHVTAEQARKAFLDNANIDRELSSLSAEVFPPSLEVTLRTATTVQRTDAIASRVSQFGVVRDVESYRGWFERLETLLAAGRGMAGALAALVVFCVLAVVGNTIRLAVAGRKREIEVMKLCGATDRFVRAPFVVEGALQGLAASVLALLLLLIAFFLLQGTVNATLAALTGLRVAFLGPLMMLGLVVGGALMGAAGSALSLRRYLTV